MDIAFLHPNYPGAEGSGAVHTALLGSGESLYCVEMIRHN